MPYNDPEPTDPNVLVGVSLPGNEEATREMAIAFAEEFGALGFDEKRLLDLFRRPHYAGAHRAYQLLGEKEIVRIIRESLAVWGNYRVRVRDNQTSSGNEELVQLVVPTEAERDDDERVVGSRPPNDVVATRQARQAAGRRPGGIEP